MRPINFAVIGCGMFARHMHLPNLALLDDARLHTCCDLDHRNLAASKKFDPLRCTDDFHDAITDPEVDAVIVSTSESYRLPIIKAAAEAKKPVYCEKPLADSLSTAREIERIVERSGIPFCVGHNRRCSPAMVAARELFVTHMKDATPTAWRFERPGWEKIPVGEDGGAPVVSIRINDDWKSWKSVHLEGELNRKAGLVLAEGTHFTDLATWFIDAEPVSVFCTGQGILNHSICIKYANGGLATITMAATGSLAYPKELLEAIGNAGIVVVDHMLEVRTAGVAGSAPVTRFPMIGDRHPHIGHLGGLHGWLEKRKAASLEAARYEDPMKQFTAEPNKGHREMLAEFVREIRGLRPPVCTVTSAIVAMQICLAAAKSLFEKRSVEVAEIVCDV